MMWLSESVIRVIISVIWVHNSDPASGRLNGYQARVTDVSNKDYCNKNSKSFPITETNLVSL